MFSSPRKSLCSDRDPKGTPLRARAEVSALTEAGCSDGCVFRNSDEVFISEDSAFSNPTCRQFYLLQALGIHLKEWFPLLPAAFPNLNT